MPYRVELSPAIQRDLRKLPKRTQRSVLSLIGALADEPRPSGCKQLSGADGIYRVRTGDYRVLYLISDSELLVLVLRVGHRRDVYRHVPR